MSSAGNVVAMKLERTTAVLLRRLRRVYLPETSPALPEHLMTAAALAWAELGYTPTIALAERMRQQTPERLAAVVSTVRTQLARELGALDTHKPLFANFPQGVPADTATFWAMRIIAHLAQESDAPCVLCGARGSTHSLAPCTHVVCERCFDPRAFAGCPVCGWHVASATGPDGSPSLAFTASPSRAASSKERPRIKHLDLGTDLLTDARALVEGFCNRTQSMSSQDKEDFGALVDELGERVLAWLPERIPVRENVAIVFGTLLRTVDPVSVLAAADAYLKSATDVLRVIAAYSGADPMLQATARYERIQVKTPPLRWLSYIASLLGKTASPQMTDTYKQTEVHRFKVAKLPRRVRRAILAKLESFDAERLTTDLLRHRGYWVWLGEFLHPHEYAKRYPNVARSFAVLRKKAPDGTPAPRFQSYKSRIEQAFVQRDVSAVLRELGPRPGELMRRLDSLLRTLPSGESAVLTAFDKALPHATRPMLLTLAAHFRARQKFDGKRVFWPKGDVARAWVSDNTAGPVSADAAGTVAKHAEAELLRRYSELPRLSNVLVDDRLRDVPVPFNERASSRAAIQLPRGSAVPLPDGKAVRVFLHWCEPKKGQRTDIDTSVAFYDTNWNPLDVCSYYSLSTNTPHGTVAVSSGDWTSAPFPDGASEFIDVDCDVARKSGYRYAVLLVNAFAGMPFDLLERAYAGVMLRDSADGAPFDARLVELKFDLRGSNGNFMPLVVDLDQRTVHWLDVWAAGMDQGNNAASSNATIRSVVPAILRMFGAGRRASMFELATLHAAARADALTIRRKDGYVRLQRRTDEVAAEFLRRMRDATDAIAVTDPGNVDLAVLFRGDVTLDAPRYVLFPERIASTLAASELI